MFFFSYFSNLFLGNCYPQYLKYLWIDNYAKSSGDYWNDHELSDWIHGYNRGWDKKYKLIGYICKQNDDTADGRLYLWKLIDDGGDSIPANILYYYSYGITTFLRNYDINDNFNGPLQDKPIYFFHFVDNDKFIDQYRSNTSQQHVLNSIEADVALSNLSCMLNVIIRMTCS